MPRSLRVASQYLEEVKLALVRNGFARQQDLAEDLRMSRDTISRFLNGKPVGYLSFYEICQRLGLNLEHIAADFADIENSEINSMRVSLLHNLPHRDYSQFIGREQELQQLLEYISPEYRQHMTVVQGIGGMGKTSLVIEAAYRCWEAKQQNNPDPSIPIFDAIIFTSAKDNNLLPYGLIPRPIKEVTLQDIFRTIARVLDDKSISQVSNLEQTEQVYQSLEQRRTLLIVDNMETIRGKERDDILSFLNNLPNTVQSVITTRERVILFSPISLKSLSPQDSIQLIQQQVTAKKIQLSIEQSCLLYKRFGGVPLALIYLVGQLAGKYSLERLLDNSTSLPEDVASFCFEESVKPLRSECSHSLLMSLAIFRAKAEWKALATVADLKTDPLNMEEGLDKLKQLSLVYQEDDKYKVLPITREYALVELAKYPTFEQQARERWIQYYLEFTEKYGGKDWRNWRVKYDNLEEEWKNTLQVLDWCGANGRYEDVVKIWNNIDNYIDLRGDWDTRLKWWQWLEHQSSQRFNSTIYETTHPNALATYIDALRTQAWILILKGRRYFQQADTKIKQGWEVTEENEGIYLAKTSLAIVNSIFYKIQESYPLSLKMLERAESLVKNVKIEHIEYARYYARINYCRAEIYCCSQYQNHNIEQAKTLFRQVCEKGREIGWSRIVNYAENDLANIAIQEQDYLTATNMLEKGLLQAKSHRENRRIGHWLTSHWQLALEQDDIVQAEQYAEEALDYFSEAGGFVQDNHKIKSWLKKRRH
ncbi:MAG: ATP-binding protein [Cyanobacteria bacterium P01_G01_bin.39]